MTIAVLTLPAWPPAVFALILMGIYWAGWHCANWAHQPPKPKPWRPYRPAHHGPIREVDPEKYARQVATIQWAMRLPNGLVLPGTTPNPVGEPDPANYGRHAVQTNPDGTLVELEEPTDTLDQADWYQAHIRRLHAPEPDPACMFCKVNQMAEVARADWHETHLNGFHRREPDPNCRFCRVEQIAGVSS